MMKDFKYLAALTIPIAAVVSLTLKGYWSYLTPIYAFVIIPILEIIMPQDPSNLTKREQSSKSSKRFFDWMLYMNIPIVFCILLYALFDFSSHSYELYETIGLVLSVGIVLGVNGINVGHELGHRQSSNERYLGKLLLLPSFYMHFYIEHNFGHHVNAATHEDPATAKYNQNLYSFWITSIIGQYLSAWKLQTQILKREQKGFVSFKNDMLWYTLIQLSYAFLVYWFFGLNGLYFALSAGLIGFLLLETVNYIEHYGLVRKKLSSGRYERVKEIHSWNSNHIIGRIVLYELTRHSDHHYKSSKKYQLLDCHDSSPQMPYGYPTSMVLSFLPPLWFKIMNTRIPSEMKTTHR